MQRIEFFLCDLHGTEIYASLVQLLRNLDRRSFTQVNSHLNSEDFEALEPSFATTMKFGQDLQAAEYPEWRVSVQRLREI